MELPKNPSSSEVEELNGGAVCCSKYTTPNSAKAVTTATTNSGDLFFILTPDFVMNVWS